MKSVHYIATVVSTYRMLIDDYLNDCLEDIEFYKKEIKKAENRLSSTGFLSGDITKEQQLYNMRSEVPTKEFVGIVKEYDMETNIAIVEQRNYFTKDDVLEVFGPNFRPKEFRIEEVKDIDDNVLDAARHPKQMLKIKIPYEIKEYSMIRKVK